MADTPEPQSTKQPGGNSGAERASGSAKSVTAPRGKGSAQQDGLPAGGGHGGGRPLRKARTDLTTGSVRKKLFIQAWPQVIENILNIADQMVDLFWAGRLEGGFRAIAGLGVDQSFTQFVGMSRQGLDQPMRAMVS